MHRILPSLALLLGCAHQPTVAQAVDAAQVATLTIGAASHVVEPKDDEERAKLEALRSTLSEIEALLADLDKLAPDIDAIIESRKAEAAGAKD